MPTADDFDAWEQRTRGYQVWPYSVELEPAFEPLFAANPGSSDLDDGRRPGIVGAWFGKNRTSRPTPPQRVARPRQSLKAELVELQLVLPDSFLVRVGLAADLFNALHNLDHNLSYELIGLHEGIVIQCCCAASDQRTLLEVFRAFFPEVRIKQHQRFLEQQWCDRPRYLSMIDFGLYGYCFQMLEAGSGLVTDPLIGVIGALNELRENELGVVQVLFGPGGEAWIGELENFAHSVEAGAEVLPLIRKKFSTRPHAAVIRVAALSATPEDSFARARSIGNALLAATQTAANGLIPLENEAYPSELHEADFLGRTTHRSGMILSAAELLTLVHLPSALVRSDRLLRQDSRTRPAPEIARHGELLLGTNEHDGETVEVRLSTEQRLKHTYLIGASGTGKSTLLLSMILQDIAAGRGVAVLDPHGDLVDDILGRLPEARAADVVLFDPSDAEYPVGFNVLSAHSELERTQLLSDLVGVFRRMTTSWGDQMTAVFGNAVAAILESSNGGTLLDLRRFLVDDKFRAQFLKSVQDPEVVYFWRTAYPLLKGFPQAPLLTRLDAFLRPKSIRYMVAQGGERLDFRALMDSRKVFLARLSQGAIGEENSYLLGSLLTAKISQAAASRQEQAASTRVPFFCYIDEFQNYVTPSLAQLLAGVRKYSVGLTLAHQDLRQIRSRSEDVASAVLANAHTRLLFRVGEHDAKALAESLGHFEAADLQNLGVGESIVRMERSAFDFNMQTVPAAGVKSARAADTASRVREQSRRQYATPRADVERGLADSYPTRPTVEARPTSRSVTASNNSSDSLPTTGPSEIVLSLEGPSVVEPNIPANPARGAGISPLPGRGGPQHKYLQALLKRTAEDRGYGVVIEKRVLDGAGHVDVVLQRDGLSIGCEICVTTGVAHELDNLSKCLAAGFDYAVLISSEKRTLDAARKQMLAEATGDESDRLRFVTPDGFLVLLEELDAKTANRSTTIRGYRVKVKHRVLTEEDRKARQEMLADVIAKSLRKTKKR